MHEESSINYPGALISRLNAMPRIEINAPFTLMHMFQTTNLSRTPWCNRHNHTKYWFLWL